jgi:hypothetical protein
MNCGARFSVLRRTSVRRVRARHSTMGIGMLPQPIQLSPGYFRYMQRCVRIHVCLERNDLMIPAARSFGQCARVSDWLREQCGPSATAVPDLRPAWAAATRVHGSPLLQMLPSRRARTERPAESWWTSNQRFRASAATSVQSGLCPNNGPSIRMLRRQIVFRVADKGLLADFHRDAQSRIAIGCPDKCAVVGGDPSLKESVRAEVILSVFLAGPWAKAHGCTLKRAPLRGW